MLERPRDLEWRVVRYEDPFVPLLPSDEERARGIAAPASVPASPTSRWSVVLEFSLPPSAYATMLLREVTKQSSEVAAQVALNE